PSFSRGPGTNRAAVTVSSSGAAVEAGLEDRDQSSRQDDVDLAGREVVGELVAVALGRVLGDHCPVWVLQRLTNAVEHEHVALLHVVVVGWVDELEGEDAEVDEVLPVDAGEVLGD